MSNTEESGILHPTLPLPCSLYKLLPKQQADEAPLPTAVAGEKWDSLARFFPRALGHVSPKVDNCRMTRCKSAKGAAACFTAAAELQQQQDTASVKPQIENDYPPLGFAAIDKKGKILTLGECGGVTALQSCHLPMCRVMLKSSCLKQQAPVGWREGLLL